MNWLSSMFKRTGITVRKESKIPEGLWHQCASCSKNISMESFKKNLYVCEHCNYHEKIPLLERINSLFDKDFTYIDIENCIEDPLEFSDVKSYKSRLNEAREKTGSRDAFKIVDGLINELPVIGMFMDFNFIGGSMGVALGDAIVTSCEEAINRNIPLIMFTSSGGARMQEGLFSLMQMPRTILAVENLKKFGLPFILILTNPTTGGVLASFAMRGTFTIAEPGAIIGFAGARVIKDTIGIKLPQGFQTAEFLLQKGFIDQIINRIEQRKKISNLLKIVHPLERKYFPVRKSDIEPKQNENY